MPPIRRTYKVVRSEITSPSTTTTTSAADGACTITSLSYNRSDPTLITAAHPFSLAPDERPCVAWLDWQGHHAKFYCVFNTTSRRYSDFVMERGSVDSPAAAVGGCFDARIWFADEGFAGRVRCANGGSERREAREARGVGRVRDGDRNFYMVIEVRVDDGVGGGGRGGRVWAKYMKMGWGEEVVEMTLQEGLELGCAMEVETGEERGVRVRERVEMWKLQRELVKVQKRLADLEKELAELEEMA